MRSSQSRSRSRSARREGAKEAASDPAQLAAPQGSTEQATWQGEARQPKLRPETVTKALLVERGKEIRSSEWKISGKSKMVWACSACGFQVNKGQAAPQGRGPAKACNPCPGEGPSAWVGVMPWFVAQKLFPRVWTQKQIDRRESRQQQHSERKWDSRQWKEPESPEPSQWAAKAGSWSSKDAAAPAEGKKAQRGGASSHQEAPPSESEVGSRHSQTRKRTKSPTAKRAKEKVQRADSPSRSSEREERRKRRRRTRYKESPPSDDGLQDTVIEAWETELAEITSLNEIRSTAIASMAQLAASTQCAEERRLAVDTQASLMRKTDQVGGEIQRLKDRLAKAKGRRTRR